MLFKVLFIFDFELENLIWKDFFLIWFFLLNLLTIFVSTNLPFWYIFNFHSLFITVWWFLIMMSLNQTHKNKNINNIKWGLSYLCIAETVYIRGKQKVQHMAYHVSFQIDVWSVGIRKWRKQYFPKQPDIHVSRKSQDGLRAEGRSQTRIADVTLSWGHLQPRLIKFDDPA